MNEKKSLLELKACKRDSIERSIRKVYIFSIRDTAISIK